MLDPHQLLELTKNHKEIWEKNEIPITQEEKRYYKCSNPDGPVDNSTCPPNDPHCNCPCKELQPRNAFIYSTRELYDLSAYLEEYSYGLGLLVTGGPSYLFDLIRAASNELYGDVNSTDEVFVVLDNNLEKLDQFPSYQEALEFVQGLEPAEEPTDQQLEDLLQESKLCDAIESSLGEEYLGCIWDDPDNPASCNCPCIGKEYPKWKEYTSTYSTFWDTPKDTILLRNAQMTLINAQKAQMTIAGDFSLKPGSIIRIKIKEIDLEGNEKNKSASGKWLVDSVSHFIDPQTHVMQVTLTRDSSYVDVEDYSEV